MVLGGRCVDVVVVVAVGVVVVGVGVSVDVNVVDDVVIDVVIDVIMILIMVINVGPMQDMGEGIPACLVSIRQHKSFLYVCVTHTIGKST